MKHLTRQLFPPLALIAVLTAGLLSALAPGQTVPARPPRLPATVTGTPGSYAGGGNVVARAGDGDPLTFFDGPAANGNVVVLDLGSAQPVGAIAYAPRPGWAGRMVGGVVQGSVDPAFAAGVTTLATVTAAPPDRALTTVPLAAPAVARYVRYVSPAGSFGDIAELQAIGTGVALTATPAAAVLTTAPAALPATAPAAPPPVPPAALAAIVCGSGTTAAPANAYRSPVQVPCVVWLDASAVSSVRGDVRLWHTGAGSAPVPEPRHLLDPVRYPAATLDPDNSLRGPVAAVLYEAAGAYAPSCDVTPRAGGATVTYGVSLTLDVDRRQQVYLSPAGDDAAAGDQAHPWLSPAKLGGRSNLHATILPGTYPLPTVLPGSILLGNNVVVDGVRDAAGNRPVLMCGACPAFFAWHGADNVLIRGIRFDSAGVVQGGRWVAPATDHGRAQPLQSLGFNVALYDCEFGCLTQGPLQLAGDMAVLRCGLPDPTRVAGQGVMADGPGRLVVAHCDLRGCYGQATVRMDGVAGGQSGSVEANLVGQAIGTTIAAVDLRSADGFAVLNNAVLNAQVSMSSSADTPGSVTRNVLVSGNAYRMTGKLLTTNWVAVKQRAGGVAVVGEDFGAGMLAGVGVNAGLVDVAIDKGR